MRFNLFIFCAIVFANHALLESAYAVPTNFVVIVTDDQRFDSLWSMPIVTSELVDKGVMFENAYVTTPSCCPSRGSFLSGGYLPQNSGVLTPTWRNGGFENFADVNALAPILSAAGYRTAMLGKYLNGYDYDRPEAQLYYPPGWTTFKPAQTFDNDLLSAQAIEFLSANANDPFFLYVAPYAPHYPAIPAAEDSSRFSDFTFRERGHGESDFSDKPDWVNFGHFPYNRGRFNNIDEQDEFHRDQLRTLQGVDRLVGDVVVWLEANGKLESTIIFFTSDNGFMWGEHGLFEKNLPYEESIRVPLVVRADGLVPRVEEKLAVENLDIAATIIDLSGIPVSSDGLSLWPLLSDPQAPWRTELHVQTYGLSGLITPRNMWSGLRRVDASGNWKYVEYPSGEAELYDLQADPFELDSMHTDPAYSTMRQSLAESLAGRRGFSVINLGPPPGSINEPFHGQFLSWGGSGGQVAWNRHAGLPPDGLSLDEETGVLSGIPVESGEFNVVFLAVDQLTSTYTGENQQFFFRWFIEIEPFDGDGIPNPGDNCPDQFNPGQEDVNADGEGDVCDDSDSDGLFDAADNCLFVENIDQYDSNSDGVGNICDPDIVGVDGVPANDCTVDFFDVAAIKQAFLTDPTSANWNSDADFDHDNFIGFLDVTIMKDFFLTPPGPAANRNATSGCLP